MPNVDLSVVTAATFLLSRRGPTCAPDTQLSWPATITEQNEASLACERRLDEGDADVLGVYDVLLRLTVPDGAVRVDLGQLEIAPYFGQGTLTVGGQVVLARPALAGDVSVIPPTVRSLLMSITKSNRVFVSNVPAAPAAGATVVLFASHPRQPGGSGTAVTSTFTTGSGTESVKVNPDSIQKVEIVWTKNDQASAANGVRAYITDDGGETWNETDLKGYVNGVANQPSIGAAAPIQVPALSAGQEWSETFEVDQYKGFAVEYTAGATGPTADTGWLVSVAVECAPQ